MALDHTPHHLQLLGIYSSGECSPVCTHDPISLKPWLLVLSLQWLFHRFVCSVDFFVFWFDWGPLGFPLHMQILGFLYLELLLCKLVLAKFTS